MTKLFIELTPPFFSTFKTRAEMIFTYFIFRKKKKFAHHTGKRRDAGHVQKPNSEHGRIGTRGGFDSIRFDSTIRSRTVLYYQKQTKRPAQNGEGCCKGIRRASTFSRAFRSSRPLPSIIYYKLEFTRIGRIKRPTCGAFRNRIESNR